MFKNKQISAFLYKMEKTTADLVREELEKDIFIQYPLSKNIINHSSLARLLLPKIRKKNPKATIESITVSIARYSNKTNVKIENELKNQISNSQISMKNDIVHTTFPRNNSISIFINKVANKIKWDLDEILFINQGSGEITIVFDKKNKNLFEDIVSQSIEIRDNSAILSIREANIKNQTPSIEVPGLYAYFINQISRNGVNLLDIISTKSQITFVINENDLTKCYNIINECIKHYRDST